MSSSSDIIRKNYAKYMKQYGSHDKVAAQLEIDLNAPVDDWDYYSKRSLEWWGNNYNPDWKPPVKTPEEIEAWKISNGFTGRPKGWRKPYSKFTKENLLVKAMKEDIKNKDYTRRTFYSSNSSIGYLFDKLEKEYDMAG
jgi:hypothetical protein